MLDFLANNTGLLMGGTGGGIVLFILLPSRPPERADPVFLTTPVFVEFVLPLDIFPQTGVFSTGRGSYSLLKQCILVGPLLPRCREILPQLPPIVFPFKF